MVIFPGEFGTSEPYGFTHNVAAAEPSPPPNMNVPMQNPPHAAKAAEQAEDTQPGEANVPPTPQLYPPTLRNLE